MRLRRLVARGFRNLADLDCAVPGRGLALLGDNAQGKTNFLEAVYYPVLFRSFRGATDQEVAGFGSPGFHVEVSVEGPAGSRPWRPSTCRRDAGSGSCWTATSRSGSPRPWAAGWRWCSCRATWTWPSGPAARRRQYLDRLLSLADRGYLRALARYRAALAQRNSALRQGRPGAGLGVRPAARVRGRRGRGRAGAVGPAGPGALRRRVRRAWASAGRAALSYRGDPQLADPGAWARALGEAQGTDRARGVSTVGPHRDDLTLEIAGLPIREYGSTGQQRSAAVALKLLEMATLREARDTEPALLLDDVFAELDDGRRQRLAARLIGPEERQVFLTAPRHEELPRGLGLEVWSVTDGRVAGPRPAA